MRRVGLAGRRESECRNPTLIVAIKDPAQFFGRAREVSKIFSRIGASRPQSISVVGDRRIGKSSLLHFINHQQIRSRYLDHTESFAFAFIDLQQKRRLTLTEFFKELFTLVAREVNDDSVRQMDPTFDSVRLLLENFRRDGRKLVVLFDEFDAITTNHAFDLEFYSFLRSVANNYGDVAMRDELGARSSGTVSHPAHRGLSVLQHLYQRVSALVQ
jgi:AAA+ ATPase superfamily predicted ATPase